MSVGDELVGIVLPFTMIPTLYINDYGCQKSVEVSRFQIYGDGIMTSRGVITLDVGFFF